MNDMAFITKVAFANQRPHYWVRFARTIKGELVLISHKRFYWHEYEGGQEEALFWARDWRDWEYRDLLSRGLIKSKGEWVGGVPPCYTEPRADNTTGKCGVQRQDYKSIARYRKKDGSIRIREKRNFCYAAVWIEYVEEDGIVRRKYRSRYFSIHKNGEEGAKKLASEARDQVEKYLKSPEHQALRQRYQKARSS